MYEYCKKVEVKKLLSLKSSTLLIELLIKGQSVLRVVHLDFNNTIRICLSDALYIHNFF